ncbi:hypothetical protein SAMN02745121_04661 [Nannocystis exedens]|uniref:PQQ-like domain-containing protein n=1 Tax=Nannocystis exedens TaxID=54 RepID=A0A1I2BG63_9BACT|nr:hypothetical protein [Nannocystis exedens]PCC67996.1 hypothetical protein NAEX_01004 [Nannocystis exedens]SFE55039.1 hypothetical protein SAMN02745121_04661 [Nannocystis exedens]
MKRRASPSLPGIVVLGLAACTAPGLGPLTYDQPPGETSTSAASGASDGAPPTTDEPVPTTGTTGEPSDPSTAGSGSTGETGSTTADAPLAPPAIVENILGPDPLEQPGPVVAQIGTAYAEGVRMQIDGGPAIELGPAGDDQFQGEIAVHTALDNGPHLATFVAWRDELESEPLEIPFTVALPPPGSELFWEGDNAIGKGTVVALAVTPKPELIELGTYYPQGQARCYLRRRDLDGTWGAGDLFEVKPGLPCSAIDLAVDDQGALHVLVDKLEDGELRWWLGKFDAWAGDPTNVGSGVVGDVARALALADDRLAVCGTKPDGKLATAAVWLFIAGEPGKNLTYDYVPDTDPPVLIGFNEAPNDCGFVNEHLLVTGELRGWHDKDTIRVRQFLLDIHASDESPVWRVAPPDSGSQSGGRVLAVDAGGRAMTGGYFCGDPCEHTSELRMFSDSGSQVWQRSLDPLLADPRALAWHPAGYVVFVAARDGPQGSTSFFAEAWFPLEAKPLWSYDHQDALAVHTPTALAIGPYGQIYAGGMTAGGYPAVAFIAP